MKKLKNIFSLLALVSVSSGALAAGTPPLKSSDRLPMAMYIWHGCMRDSDFVNRIDFGNFDTVYLMDRGFWNSQEEFDRDADSILATPSGMLPFSKPGLFRLAVDDAHAMGTKAMVSVGNDFLHAALDPGRRDKMTRIICRSLEQMDFDGLDVDWEIGVYNRYDIHADLMSTLRSALDSLSQVTGKTYTLSTALSAEAPYPDASKPKLAAAVDYVNLMSYDLGGCLWRNYASHNTPMKSIADDVVRYWSGVPPHQLHLGLASYGFLYRGILPDERVPEGKTIGDYGRFADYLDMLPMTFKSKDWRKEYDPVEKMYYFINDGEHSFITMETPETIVHKFDYAVEAGLGGTFWWEYAKDIIPDPDGGRYWKHILVPRHRQVSPLERK